MHLKALNSLLASVSSYAVVSYVEAHRTAIKFVTHWSANVKKIAKSEYTTRTRCNQQSECHHLQFTSMSHQRRTRILTIHSLVWDRSTHTSREHLQYSWLDTRHKA